MNKDKKDSMDYKERSGKITSIYFALYLFFPILFSCSRNRKIEDFKYTQCAYTCEQKEQCYKRNFKTKLQTQMCSEPLDAYEPTRIERLWTQLNFSKLRS